MRVRWGLAGTAALVLSMGGPAYAANFYAADSAVGGGDCLSAANACTIQTALGLVSLNASVDTLFLAPGDYNDAEDALDVDGPGFDGLTIEGAGRDVSAGGTRLTQPFDATVPFQFGDASDDQTIRNVTLAASAGNTAAPIVRNDGRSLTLENVDVYGAPGRANQRGIEAMGAAPNLTVEGSRVFLDAQGAPAFGGTGINFSSSTGAGEGTLTVRGSTVEAVTSGMGMSGIYGEGDFDAVIDRSVVRLRRPGGGPPVGTAIAFDGAVPPDVDPDFTVTDSAVAGFYYGINPSAGGAAPGDANSIATASILRNSIDVGAIGVADTDVEGIRAGAFQAGQVLDITIRDNVLADRGSVVTNGIVTINLDCDSNFFAAEFVVSDGDACTRTNTGELGTELPDLTEANAWSTTGTPASAVATAFRPAPDSVLLDTATGTGISATDLAGNPRAVDAGDADCIAQVDRGAFERQDLAGPANVCNALPPCTNCGGGVVQPPLVIGAISRLALVPRSPRTKSSLKALLTYRLSAGARVSAKLERRGKGRRIGRRCVKPTRRNRKRKPCRRFAKVGRTVTRSGTAGAGGNRLALRAFTRKRLKPGRYRVTLKVAGGRSYRLSLRVRK